MVARLIMTSVYVKNERRESLFLVALGMNSFGSRRLGKKMMVRGVSPTAAGNVLFREKKKGGEVRRVLRGQWELIFSVVQETVTVVHVLVSSGGCHWCGFR